VDLDAHAGADGEWRRRFELDSRDLPAVDGGSAVTMTGMAANRFTITCAPQYDI